MNEINQEQSKLLLDLSCQFFEIDRELLLSKQKNQELIRPRRFIMAFLKSKGLKEKSIASVISKDRTTIYHHLKKHKNFFDVEKQYKEDFENFEEFLQNQLSL